MDDLSVNMRMPVFLSSHDLAVQWKPYQVRAALLNTGEAASRGHYRSILRSGENSWHLTDDGIPAQLQSSASVQLESASAYILFCTEVSE